MIILWDSHSRIFITDVLMLVTICSTFADFVDTIILPVKTTQVEKHYEASQFTRFLTITFFESFC